MLGWRINQSAWAVPPKIFLKSINQNWFFCRNLKDVGKGVKLLANKVHIHPWLCEMYSHLHCGSCLCTLSASNTSIPCMWTLLARSFIPHPYIFLISARNLFKKYMYIPLPEMVIVTVVMTSNSYMYLLHQLHLVNGWHGNQKKCLGRTEQSQHELPYLLHSATLVATLKLSLKFHHSFGKTFTIIGVSIYSENCKLNSVWRASWCQKAELAGQNSDAGCLSCPDYM